MRWRIVTLGTFECWVDGGPSALSALHRALLVRLLDAGAQGLPVERLWEAVWGDADLSMPALHQALRDELRALAEDPQRLADYAPALAPLGALVAPYLGVRPDDPERLAARLGDVEALLLGLLSPDPSAAAHAAPPVDPPAPDQPRLWSDV